MRHAAPVLIAVLVLLGTAPATRADDQGLEIVEPDKVVFTTTDQNTKTVSVWVKNATADAVTPEFELVAEKDDGSLLGDKVTVRAEDPVASTEPGGVGHYRIHVQGASPDANAAGQLVARAGSAPPGTVPASLGPEPNVIAGADDPLWIRSSWRSCCWWPASRSPAERRTLRRRSRWSRSTLVRALRRH